MPVATDLHDYLVYARDHLGVQSACDYETAFHNDDYGPDVIGSLSVPELTAYGMSKGDAIRLIGG